MRHLHIKVPITTKSYNKISSVRKAEDKCDVIFGWKAVLR